jgi:hypothetical protein
MARLHRDAGRQRALVESLHGTQRDQEGCMTARDEILGNKHDNLKLKADKKWSSQGLVDKG